MAVPSEGDGEDGKGEMAVISSVVDSDSAADDISAEQHSMGAGSKSMRRSPSACSSRHLSVCLVHTPDMEEHPISTATSIMTADVDSLSERDPRHPPSSFYGCSNDSVERERIRRRRRSRKQMASCSVRVIVGVSATVAAVGLCAMTTTTLLASTSSTSSPIMPPSSQIPERIRRDINKNDADMSAQAASLDFPDRDVSLVDGGAPIPKRRDKDIQAADRGGAGPNIGRQTLSRMRRRSLKSSKSSKSSHTTSDTKQSKYRYSSSSSSSSSQSQESESKSKRESYQRRRTRSSDSWDSTSSRNSMSEYSDRQTALDRLRTRADDRGPESTEEEDFYQFFLRDEVTSMPTIEPTSEPTPTYSPTFEPTVEPSTSETIIIQPTTTPPPTPEGVITCVDSGGAVANAMCCRGVGDFPDTCLIGACGCSPLESEMVLVCECPAGQCFNGIVCRDNALPPEPTPLSPTFDPTLDPTFDPTESPTFDPTMDPTLDPTKDPIFDPTMDPTSDPTQNPTLSDDFDCTRVIDDNGLVRLSWDFPFEDGAGQTLLRLRMKYAGEAWLGWGVPETENSGMVGSDAVIGLPNLPDSRTNPGRYELNGRSLSQIDLIPNRRQTLIDASIEQTGSSTAMTFTYILNERESDNLFDVDEQTIIWAYGFSNTLGYHRDRGRSTIDFTVCPPTSAPTSIETLEPTQDPTPEVKPTASPTSDPFDCTRIVDDNGFVKFSWNEPFEVAGRPLLTARISFSGIGWVGWGIPASSAGQMIGSDAVIGLPDLPNSRTNPGKYSLNAKNLAGVVLDPLAEQDLIDSSIVQTDEDTVMTFTYILNQGGFQRVDVDGGMNTFIWAYGFSNTLGYHRNRGSFETDFSCQPTQAPTVGPDTVEPTLTPSAAPQSTTQLPTQDFEYEMTVDGNGWVRYAWNTPFQTNGRLALTSRLTYDGIGWLGYGVPDSPEGNMIGSTAVIGKPDEPEGRLNPGKYKLEGRFVGGIVPFPLIQQTLIGATIEQSVDRTTMTWTMILNETDFNPINEYNQTLIWAYGLNNNFGLHQDRGSFVVNLMMSTQAPSAMPSDSPSSSPSVSAMPTTENRPSASPSLSSMPSLAPSVSAMPSSGPSDTPSVSHRPSISSAPTISASPSTSHSPSISLEPTMFAYPSVSPAPSTSSMPSDVPSDPPSISLAPSSEPSQPPTTSNPPSVSFVPTISLEPSISHSPSISAQPTSSTERPSTTPSISLLPSTTPSSQPSVSMEPSTVPSQTPSVSLEPSAVPSTQPSISSEPSPSGTAQPSISAEPSTVPSQAPSISPEPSTVPSAQPSISSEPSSSGTPQPSISAEPSTVPSPTPSLSPSATPSVLPSLSAEPSASGTPQSSISAEPTPQSSISAEPTPQSSISAEPSTVPSPTPSLSPSATPSVLPSAGPSTEPSTISTSLGLNPSSSPSTEPSSAPSSSPSNTPSAEPSSEPSLSPSNDPSADPSSEPSLSPSAGPSASNN